MPEVFADSFYWIALSNPADAWHRAAMEFSQTPADTILVTTDEALSEFLNYFSAAGERKRVVVASMFEQSMNHDRIVVLPQTRDSLLSGWLFTKLGATKDTALLIVYL